MSSEEKITPEEFDQELERLMSSEGGTKKKKGGKKRKIILIAAAALVAGAIGFNALAGARQSAPAVGVLNPARKDIENRLAVSGPVAGTDSVDVVSNLHAEVLSIPVQEGDKVTEGQILAVLDDTDLKKEVAIAKNNYDLAVSTCAEQDRQARSGYEKAVQDFQTAQANYDRAKALYDSGSTSYVELETAQNNLNDARRQRDSYTLRDGVAVADDSYRLQVEKARFDYEKVEEQLGDTQIKSPIDGTVVRVNTKIGRFADTTENDAPIFIIENLEVLEMEIPVSEYSIGKVAVGQEADITADILDGQVAKGQVISISPTGEVRGGGSTERVIPTTIRIMDQNTKLIAGITARAEILLEEAKDALSVPASAILSSGGEDYVQVVSNSQIHWVPVELGVEGDVDTEVIPADGENLDESSFVVSAPNEAYAEGMTVMPVPQ
ncbi:MAG TPA: efflux RND transporter periplasmic adaptor subunit [Candidatus Copromonas faecavium]|uniref:Efflux RND transporter periplasmic adaptor subunit n=1 Tax=Candidatus Copromonas faecavium (nom. illeg.) TaxID=2840740 RepID=A0A9D1D459_9FIRM|nr:efflux RND transporter periplasmic adaptor subunit [Candidatus Copromonas faecavium]